MADDDLLTRVLACIEREPHGATALTLYALANTLERPGAGCLFKLDKLKDLDPEARRLAYGLMERMARDEIGGADWQAARTRMDELVRGG